MGRKAYYGICSLCGARLSDQRMTLHLDDCAPSHDKPKGKEYRLLRLRVQGDGMPEYWLDMEVKAGAKLRALDDFLRRIWLECCGHMSAFYIDEIMYSSYMGGGMVGDRSMNVRLDQAVTSTRRFMHDYDFGTTTRLVLQLSSERQGVIGRNSIRLLARNEPLVWPCDVCGEPATRVCTFCSERSFCCDAHSANHPCGQDGFLPVVNSPRMGVCGYTGHTGDPLE